MTFGKYDLKFIDKSGKEHHYTLLNEDISKADERGKIIANLEGWTYVSSTYLAPKNKFEERLQKAESKSNSLDFSQEQTKGKKR
ncbi:MULTISPECIES: hypothetical protein [unclassified Lactococcus]|uniref:hypothetical protein n=1 Tax=unclassified Lactococcus TaxID=2643510 RepID=UPI0011CAD88A|nr:MULTISPECIES: hypothetical protein [unclassified Lactococcus]MQW23433.1 hypothetical protein [Lactococcus sp. dk101]TXK37055.1 hypothetical protein FVP42_10035 [Lactococcus sp. dk310]TXK37287.1 hypothetical protein FVP42_09265 [Lactococcus sp. dk310]TXK47717.1 hypothetical protein FVP43_09820 [Lactococcus sp. dk322]